MKMTQKNQNIHLFGCISIASAWMAFEFVFISVLQTVLII